MHILIKNKSLIYNNYKVKCALGKRGIGLKRREGDVAACYADPSKAKKVLNWKTNYNLDQMCLSAWEFSKLNS